MLSLIQAAALCPTSPTGKHHWMIPTAGTKPIGICKYCLAKRRFENSAGEGYWEYRSEGEREARKYVGQNTEHQVFRRHGRRHRS